MRAVSWPLALLVFALGFVAGAIAMAVFLGVSYAWL
jgi:hypothetical protein